MKRAIYLETGSTDPAYNLAFEEHILHTKKEDDIMILWQNDNAVIIGRNQNAEEEIDKRYVKENGIKVIRRNTGGGAVYHDLGNLNFSFITDVEDESKLSITRFTEIVVNALRGLGLQAEASGRNDILISGRKISGTAQHLYKKRILYHGTLVFDSDIGKIAGALNADETKFESKSAKSVESRVGNIKDWLEEGWTMEKFRRYLKDNMISSGIEETDVTEEAVEAVNVLKREKYDTWEWNYGKAPEFSMKTKKRWPGGTVQAALRVSKGIVEEIWIYGDFLALIPIDETLGKLKGCRFTKQAFAGALEDTDFEKVFGGITKEQLLETIFRD